MTRTINLADLEALALAAGWTKNTRAHFGRTFFRTPQGRREWLDSRDNACSVGFWFLFNA